jgi:hypothetical protein
VKTQAESAPSFSVGTKTSVKLPLVYIIALVSGAAGGVLAWARLSSEISEQRRDLGEANRVNSAQDRRFENLEADFRYLERQEARRE